MTVLPEALLEKLAREDTLTTEQWEELLAAAQSEAERAAIRARMQEVARGSRK